VNRNNLIQILLEPDRATLDDYYKVRELAEDHTFSGALQTLLVYLTKKFEPGRYDKTLHRSAVTITDRGILKNYLENPDILKGFIKTDKLREENKEEQDLTKGTKEQEAPSSEDYSEITTDTEETSTPQEPISEEGSESSHLFTEVMKNLDQLKGLRKKYDFLEDSNKEWEKKHFPGPEGIDEAEERSTEKPEIQEGEMETEEETEYTTESIKDVEEESRQDDKETDSPQLMDTSGPNMQQKGYSEEEDEVSGHHSEDMEPEVRKTKSQRHSLSDLIDQFIEKEPNISRKGRSTEEENPSQQDLSIPSTTINDDIVSENLANIFLKQGKKEKAIEIYKKLIWKFPQKKTYFASRIEELKE
jgi:tetratricopeptide (TPR) repeat protein